MTNRGMRIAAELLKRKPGNDPLGGAGIPGLAGKVVNPGKTGKKGNNDVFNHSMFAS